MYSKFKYIKIIVKIIFCLTITNLVFAEEILPFKVDNFENLSSYKVPQSSIFSVDRPQNTAPKIIYYLTKPAMQANQQVPITIFVSGSSSKGALHSVIHVHRYFLAEVLSLTSAMLTVEQWGINNDKIDEPEFFEHYTRSQRYEDHSQVIKHLQAKPPKWWNGKIALIGVSEGGVIVSQLAAEFNDLVVATINWVGAGDWNWRDELYQFVENEQKFEPLKYKIQRYIFDWWEGRGNFSARQKYDLLMDHISLNPTIDEEFMSMTYKYHADAMNFLPPNYKKLTKPFLVVAGALDSNADIRSTADFVSKALAAGANITYLKVPDMDHYIRKRPEIIEQSFLWLKKQL